MTEPYRVRVVRRAAGQIKSASAWWRENRLAAPNAVAEDLARVFELLSFEPGVGVPAANVKLQGVRRLLLARVRHHIYYRVATEERAVDVLAFWHTSRGEPPPMS